jgi:hypothetical protein
MMNSPSIRRVTVAGAGVLGAQIAFRAAVPRKRWRCGRLTLSTGFESGSAALCPSSPSALRAHGKRRALSG